MFLVLPQRVFTAGGPIGGGPSVRRFTRCVLLANSCRSSGGGAGVLEAIRRLSDKMTGPVGVRILADGAVCADGKADSED